MAKQKNTPLSSPGLDAVDTSTSDKPKRKNNRGCGCLIFIVVMGVIFAAAGASKKPPAPTPAAALAATDAPQTKATNTVTPYPDITMTATQPATFEEEESSLKELPGVISVEQIKRRDTDYFAIVKTHPKFNKESFAGLLYQQAVKVDLYTFRFAVQIDDGESEPLWWINTDNEWSSAKEPPAWVDLGTTQALSANITATSAPTTQDVTKINAATYYADGAINVRSCADSDCSLVLALARGDSMVANGTIEGRAVNSGNKIWYRVTVGGKTGYVYSDLVSTVKPATTSSSGSSGGGSTGNSGGTANGGQNVTPIESAPKVWDCSGDIYNCGSFNNRAEMRSYFEQCPGDPSNLDGNADGQYCESN